MDSEVIQRYFLQVGRSFYVTDEFRRTFGFIPASRFGVGFLSVFAVSDDVTVETYKPSSPRRDGPIRLTLTGPRNYLLTERGTRGIQGTRIEVLLRERMEPGTLSTLLQYGIRRAEFPVTVDDLGNRETITAEKPEEFLYELPVVGHEGKFVVRFFPINRPGIEGELYVFARIGDAGERWDSWQWAVYTYPYEHPQAARPKFPGNLVCLHGLTVFRDEWDHPPSARIDLRGEVASLTLSRGDGIPRNPARIPEIADRWVEILQEHLPSTPAARGPEGWKYKQRLIDDFPFPSLWDTMHETIRIFRDGAPDLISLESAVMLPELAVVIPSGYVTQVIWQSDRSEEEHVPSIGLPSLTLQDLGQISHDHRRKIFSNRLVESVQWLDEKAIAVLWVARPGKAFAVLNSSIHLVALPNPSSVGIRINKAVDNVYVDIVLNREHPFVQWLLRIQQVARTGSHGLSEKQYKTLLDLLQNAVRYRGGSHLEKLERYLEGWHRIPDLPEALHPPEVEMKDESFLLRHNPASRRTRP